MMHVPPVKDKQRLFAELVSETNSCTLCADLRERTAVLSDHNGNLSAKVLFIGEAPGRNGGDRTRKPFSGDASGANFQKFIDSINLNRADIFITNSVLCNPRKSSGANRKPTQIEIKNCSTFLRRQIELLSPHVVATLGAVALEALKSLAYHEYNLKQDAGKILEWNGALLVPLYHPSPQVLASHRRFDEQLKDYRGVAEAVRRIL